MLSKILDKAIAVTPPEILARALKIIPRGFFELKKKSSFRNTVKYAYKNSPFYKKKFDDLGIDPAKIMKPSDLGDFFTTSEDIINHAEEFLCKRPQMAFESSGTTGRNKRIYLDQKELSMIGKFMAVGLFLGGIGKTDRLLNALDFCIWIPGIITQKCIEQSGLFGMTAGKAEPYEVYKRIPQYGLTVIMGEPTWLIRLTEIAEKNGSYPLKYLIGGAEAMPDEARPWMRKVWQGAEVRMVYATVESAGIIAFEPLDSCGGYHVDENSFQLEIVNKDKDGYGEVVFTTLTRHVMPLIRYKNRDISKILPDPCSCGLPFQRIAKIRGRTDEMVVASGGNLYPLMFEEIFKGVNGMSCDWQIVFKLRALKEVMELNIELKEGYSQDGIKDEIFNNIKQRYPDLWKNLSIGIFETEFRFHPLTSLRTGHKMLRLVDKRYAK